MNIPATKLINSSAISTKKQPIFKPAQNYMEIYKIQIIKWMNTLSQIQRATVMIIKDESDIKILKDMFSQGKYDQMSYYWDETEQRIFSRDIFRYKEKGRYSAAQIKNAEAEILENVLVFTDTNEITFSNSFINKYETLLEHISTITNDLIFTYHSFGEKSCKDSVWFREKEFHTVCQWLIHKFQKEILRHFLEAKSPALHEPLVKVSNMKTFLTDKLKSNYFTADKIKKYYKDDRIQNGQQGKKHKELNRHKILELQKQKSQEQLLNDLFFDKLIKHQDPSYFVYLKNIRPIIQKEFLNLTFDELTNAEKQLKSTKSKTVKRNKNKKKKNNKKQIFVEVPEQPVKDTDDTMTETKSSNTKEMKQQQSKIESISEPKKKYKQKSESKSSYSEIHYEQVQEIKKQVENQQIQNEQLQKRSKKRPNKKVNQLINSYLKEYIDQFSNSSNKLLSWRRIVFNRLETTIANIMRQQKLFFNFNLRLFGSCALGLSMEESDIDMVLMLDTPDNVDFIVLQIIHNRLFQQRWIASNKLINCAVPLIKLQADLSIEYQVNTSHYNIINHKFSKQVPLFQVDLSIQTKGSQNLNQGIRSTDYTLSILDQYKNMRSIILFLKIFIKGRKLDLTFNGGINSYVLFLLVFAFLKHNKYLQSTQIFTPLIQLLNYYCSSFSIQSTIIDLRQQKPFIDTIPIQEKLTILDPLSETERYVNTNSSQIAKIFLLFKQLHQELVKLKQTVSHAKVLDEVRKRDIYSNLKGSFDDLMTDVIF